MRNAKILKLKLLCSLMVFCIFLLSGLYIYQTNVEISDRYLIEDYTKKISTFSKENKVLEISLARAGSLDKLAQVVEPMNFEKIDKIHYIRVLNTQAVAR